MKPNATRFRPSVSPNATMQGGKTEEVLVKGSKDLLIWRNNPAVAVETLSSLGTPSVEKLEPVGAMTLSTHCGRSRQSGFR